jgi:hypothetical protein
VEENVNLDYEVRGRREANGEKSWMDTETHRDKQKRIVIARWRCLPSAVLVVRQRIRNVG